MATEWFLYDKKDSIKNPQNVDFPFVATNWNKETKTVNTLEELFSFVLCKGDKTRAITQITAAKLHPSIFISAESTAIISHYMKFKRYGMNFLYPKGVTECPNITLEAFEIIQTLIDKTEADMIKTQKEKMK